MKSVKSHDALQIYYDVFNAFINKNFDGESSSFTIKSLVRSIKTKLKKNGFEYNNTIINSASFYTKFHNDNAWHCEMVLPSYYEEYEPFFYVTKINKSN